MNICNNICTMNLFLLKSFYINIMFSVAHYNIAEFDYHSILTLCIFTLMCYLEYEM